VKQLIYDDWPRFLQSKHWALFSADLARRVKTQDDHENGLTEFHPVEESTAKRERGQSPSTNSRSGPPRPDISEAQDPNDAIQTSNDGRLLASRSLTSFSQSGSNQDAA